jgi:hypothetical protein
MLLIFVIFLAGYFIAENDVAKRQRPVATENFLQFKNKEAESNFYPVEDPLKRSEEAVIPSAEVEDILAKIDKVYKDVFGEPVPADKMSLYYKSLGASSFDEGSFRRRLSMERKAAFETLVKDVFMDVLKRLPTPTELQKYIDLFLGNQMKTQQDLQFILRMDLETVIRSDKSDIPEPVDKEDYNTYKDIIATFESVLGRNPNTSELKFYYDLIKQNGYEQKKIKDILLSSREHEILMKNQNNLVHGDLSANITEKQLEIAVNELYKAIFFEYPDADTYKYLRGRFIAMNLDEEKLALFIKRLKSADSVSAPCVMPPTTTMPQTTTMSPKTSKEMFDEKVTATPDISSRTTAAAITQDSRALPPIPTQATKTQNPGETTNIDETIDAIKCAKYFEKSRFESAQDMREKTLGYKSSRIPSECKFNSKKTKHYLNADDNMVLRPEMRWQVPMRRAPVCYATEQVDYNPSVEQSSLIGTLLSDAQKTSVGSIMPKFEYKNIV